MAILHVLHVTDAMSCLWHAGSNTVILHVLNVTDATIFRLLDSNLVIFFHVLSVTVDAAILRRRSTGAAVRVSITPVVGLRTSGGIRICRETKSSMTGNLE